MEREKNIVPKYIGNNYEFLSHSFDSESDCDKNKIALRCAECGRRNFDYCDLKFKRSYPKRKEIKKKQKEIEAEAKKKVGEQSFVGASFTMKKIGIIFWNIITSI
jgi:hypothetical protein